MAYYGNQPIAGETNSFKVLDDISSYTKTFDGSSAAVVSTSDDTLTFYDHRFVQGQRVTYGKGSGTVITGLTDATVYYVIRQDKDTIQLAETSTKAAALDALPLNAVGSASGHTLTVAFDGTNTKFKATTGGGTHIKLTRPGQLMISMNGVVQEPQNNTPSNGFGIEGNNVIVFSTAPTVLDTFWGHYLTSNLSSWEMSDNTVDNFTGNGSTTTYTLSKTPANAENILVTVDGVTQYPSESGTTRAYTLNASVVTFTTAPALNAAIAVRHIGFAGGSGGGSGGGGVTGFYGRTGNVTVIRSDLQNTDINLKNLTGVAATFTGNVSIGGTLTYTDVTNIDAVGIITAQQGIHLGAGATVGIMNVTTGISSFRQLNVVGISTFTDTIKLKADNKKLIFGTNSNLEIYSNGTDATINAASGAIKIQKGGTGLLTFDTGGSYFLDDVQIKSTDAGATGPILKLFHDSASPADNDIIGSISMSGDDDAGNETEYTAIKTKVTDVSNGVEQSHLSFYTRGLNAWNEIFRLNNRSSASAPSYTTDDHNGIILDVYNTGNPYPRYMNFIAKSAGNTDSNITFWTEAVGGSPTEKLRIASDGDTTISTSGTTMLPGAALNVISDKNVETGVDDKANYHLVLANPNNDTGEAIGLAFGITDTTAKVGAAIIHERDAAGSQGSMKFFTRPDNSGPPAERLRITSSGQIGINQSNPARALTVNALGTGSSSRLVRLATQDNNTRFDFSFENANNLTIQNGSSDAAILKLHTSGYVTTPAQPSFSAHSTNGTWDINNGDIFGWNHTRHNTGGHFNTSNHRFTAPVAGHYEFAFYSIYNTDLNNSQNGAINMRINGSTVSKGGRCHFTKDGTSWDHVSYSVVYYLNASDYVDIVNDGGQTINYHGGSWSGFTGQLLS